jgi:hypothetical protein
MQTIEATGGKKKRYGASAALDENTMYATLDQRGEDGRRSDTSIGSRQRDNLDIGAGCQLRSFRGHQQTADAIGSKNLGARWQPPFWIEHDTRGLWTGDSPHGQFGIVGKRRADADDDGIDQRAQPMQMRETAGTVYVF